MPALRKTWAASMPRAANARAISNAQDESVDGPIYPRWRIGSIDWRNLPRYHATSSGTLRALVILAASMVSITRRRLLELAVSRIGRAAVAARLKVPVAILDDWLAGQTQLPDAKLIALIDLLDDTREIR